MATDVKRPIHFASPDEFLPSILERMRRHDVRHLPVVDQGRLVGIVSDRDVLLHAWSGLPKSFPDDVTVRDVMAREVVSAPYGTPLAEAAKMMLALRIDALPLIGVTGEIVGIVTSTDVMRLVAERSPELCAVDHTAEFMSQFRWDMPEII